MDHTIFCLDETGTILAVEGERLNIKCEHSDLNVSKIQWTKESDEDSPSPVILSKKSPWYTDLIIFPLQDKQIFLLSRFYRLHFKNVKHSDHGRYSCLLGSVENGTLTVQWRNFTMITHKRSESIGTGRQIKLTAPQSLSHKKEGTKPKFLNKLFMDNNVVFLIDDTGILSCPIESKYLPNYYEIS